MANNITIIHTYYNEKSLLEIQIERWNVYNQPANVILIDDGSQTIPAYDVIKQHKIKENINFSLYRVTEDIGFNSHGCRNLGARLANTDWLLFLDIDHTIQPPDLLKLRDYPLDPGSWYVMGVRDLKNNYRTTLNQFLIPKKMFLDEGGYDESYVPFHMGDRPFVESLEKKYNKENLDWLVLTSHRGGRRIIYDEDISIPIYDDEKMVFYMKKFDETKFNKIHSKLNFDWTRLL